MGFIRLIVILALGRRGVNVHPDDVHSQIPRTVDAAMKCFSLQSKVTIFAVCPACHCTYKPEVIPGSDNVVFPQTCSNKPLPGASACGENLLEPGSQDKPRKKFAYHSFHDYLAGMLTRPDIEKMMDDSCDTLAHDPIVVTDVLEATFLKKFCGPDGQLFLRLPGRYAFTLNVDYFNPEGRRIGGAKRSCGIISMSCLNLPLDIRYKPENMYIAGIIPGPSEPHLTALNHYLRPLVDDLIASWERGILISATALHPTGRVTNCAIAAAVCDLPAARQAAQMASHNSHFYCSVCSCHHKSTIMRTDIQEWQPRDVNELCMHAEMWRDAETVDAQEECFSTYGVRWSELWRLPYWDPTRQLVVDYMHCLLEGLVQAHVREVLGLTTAVASQKETVIPAFHHKFMTPTLSKSTSDLPSIPEESPSPSQQLFTFSERSITPSQQSFTFSERSIMPSQRSITPARSTPSCAHQPLSPAVQGIASIHKILLQPIGNVAPETYFKELERKLSQQNAEALYFVYQNDILPDLRAKRQKRRMIMAAVEVPTLQEVNRRLAKARRGLLAPSPEGNHSATGSEESLQVNQKRRMIMAAVEVPTLQEVNRRLAKARQGLLAPSPEGHHSATGSEGSLQVNQKKRVLVDVMESSLATSSERSSKRVKIKIEGDDNGM